MMATVTEGAFAKYRLGLLTLKGICHCEENTDPALSIMPEVLKAKENFQGELKELPLFPFQSLSLREDPQNNAQRRKDGMKNIALAFECRCLLSEEKQGLVCLVSKSLPGRQKY
jgi:hypothetical protein